MNKDSLSALLDGECHGAELDQLLDEMERDPELALEWSRMCKARDARAGVALGGVKACVCADVMGALDDEPVYGSDKVVEFARPVASKIGRMSRFWKPVAGFAAAASMGAAAVLLIQPQAAQQEGQAAVAQIAAVQPIQWAAPASRVAVQQVSAAPQDEHSQMLREYLIDHSNAVSGEGVGGTLRYARFAAHTAEYQPYSDEYR